MCCVVVCCEIEVGTAVGVVFMGSHRSLIGNLSDRQFEALLLSIFSHNN